MDRLNSGAESEEVDEEAFSINKSTPTDKSRLDTLLTKVRFASKVEEGWIFTTVDNLRKQAQLTPEEISDQLAAHIASGLGKELYAFDLSRGSLYILSEKGKRVIKDIRSHTSDITEDYRLLYTIAKRDFGASGGPLPGYN